MKIVLDTNVLVSGLLSPGGPPGRILDLVTSGRILLLFDDRILAEYRDVLARPRLRIAPVEAAGILELIERDGLLTVAAPLAIELPDPDDLPFLEVALAGRADFLITGNVRHFPAVSPGIEVPVIVPTAFLAVWLSRQEGNPQ